MGTGPSAYFQAIGDRSVLNKIRKLNIVLQENSLQIQIEENFFVTVLKYIVDIS